MKLFVWDLHGTLEEGNDRAVVDISNCALAELGFSQRFSYEDGQKLYGLKWYEYFEWLVPGLPHDDSLRLQEACFVISENDVEMQLRWLRPAEHALHVLAEIAGRHRQILVSNTRPATLRVFVEALRLSTFFPDRARFAINKHDRGSARTKLALLSRYLDEHGPYDEVVVIGDSRSDMNMAEAGATTYLYAHPDLDFPDCTADHRIRDLRAVLHSI